jgi:hypothetical protein
MTWRAVVFVDPPPEVVGVGATVVVGRDMTPVVDGADEGADEGGMVS